MNVALWIIAGLLAVAAMITHLRRHEAGAVVVNLAVLALAAVVAWGRFGPRVLHRLTGGPGRRTSTSMQA